MNQMLKYEIKKIFSRAGGKIAVLILFLTVGVSSFFAIHEVSYVNESGKTEYGYAAVQKLKAEKKKWKGELTTEQLAKVLEENARIAGSEEYQSQNADENNKAYHEIQGISDIRDIINSVFGGFRDYDYYKANSLTPDQAGEFYSRRLKNLEDWLADDEQNQMSEEEKQYLTARYQKLHTPLFYDDADGWTQLFKYAPTVIMMLVLTAGFLTSGIFSFEFQQKADSIFFSSYHGRKKAVRSKLAAGFLLVTVLYWLMILLYSAVVLLFLGTDGAGTAIQTTLGGFKSIFNMTHFQEYLLIIVSGYVGTLFMLTVTMVISAKTRSAILAVMVPFVLIFARSFVGGIRVFSKILGIFPDALLQMGEVLHYVNLYSVGGRLVTAVPILLILYTAVTVILYPVLYHMYKNTEIK